METIDEEFVNASLDFIDRANRDKKPFFVWFYSHSACNIWTRLKPESQGRDGALVFIPTAWWSMTGRSASF